MKDKIVVVTGGLGALGKHVAAEAASQGACVSIIDIASVAAGDDKSAKQGRAGFFIGGVELADMDATARAFDAVASAFGRIDTLINIAGGFRWERVEDGSTATWDLMHTMNLQTTLNASKAALPHLLRSDAASIVNIGANGALRAGAGMGAYAASKAGVHRLTEALAEELKGRVRVNAVLPSIIDTPANRTQMPGEDFSRWVTPQDLAAVILFLGSEQARAVTGALIPVTGRL